MKKLIITLPLLFVMGLQSCSVLEQAREYERFIACDFSVAAVDIKELAGISMADLDGPDDLGIGQMMTITQRLFSGELPAKIEVGLKATNNNTQKAAITGMEWKAMLKDEELFSGYIEGEVVVLPNSATTFPVVASIDLMRLLQSDSFQEIGGFIFSPDKKAALRKIGATLKIKPYYKVGDNIQKYPGYLTIEP